MTSTPDIKPRSRTVTDGLEATAARGMLRAVGMGDEDFAKPQIGVASSWNEITPCNLSLDRLAKESSLDTALGDMLIAISQHLGAPSSSLWLHDTNHARGLLHLVYDRGRLLSGAESGHPNARVPLPLDREAGLLPSLLRGEVSISSLREASETSYFKDKNALWVKVVSNGDPGTGAPGGGTSLQVSR